MEILQAVIAEEEWGAAAEAACAAIREQSRPGGRDVLALHRGYDHGHVRVWGFYADGARIGTALVELADYPDGRALVVHVAHGKADGLDLCATLFPAWDQIAVGLGCRWLKFETVRDGLKAKARAAGCIERSVFVKEVGHGR